MVRHKHSPNAPGLGETVRLVGSAKAHHPNVEIASQTCSANGYTRPGGISHVTFCRIGSIVMLANVGPMFATRHCNEEYLCTHILEQQR